MMRWGNLILIVGLFFLFESCVIDPVKNKASFILGSGPDSKIDLPEATDISLFYYQSFDFIIHDTSIFYHTNCPDSSKEYDKIYAEHLEQPQNNVMLPLGLDTSSLIQLVNIFHFNTIISGLENTFDIGIVIEKDSIDSDLFSEMLNTLGKNGFNSITVRSITAEENCVLQAKIMKVKCLREDINWKKMPSADFLYDFDKDGEFEIQETFKRN